MLSHRWEENEPVFEMAENMSIYDLEAHRENEKLRTFCSLVRDAGFHRAWSHTYMLHQQERPHSITGVVGRRVHMVRMT